MDDDDESMVTTDLRAEPNVPAFLFFVAEHDVHEPVCTAKRFVVIRPFTV